jgi:hypothetical protein
MKLLTVFIVAMLLLILLVSGAFAQTTGQVISVKKGGWTIVIMDSSYNPALHGPDSTFYKNRDTMTVWKVIHDTIKVAVVTNVHDTMWACGPTNTNWCPTKPLPVLYSVFTTQTLPTTTQNDHSSTGAGIEVGMKFRSSVAGYVKGVKFYKTIGNTGTHIGELYLYTGAKLASATYANETSSGWQSVLFSTSIAIAANTTYVATMYSAAGNYSSTLGGLTTAIVNPPLTALADGFDGVNGKFSYCNSPMYPLSSYKATNYWVDVIFSTNQ